GFISARAMTSVNIGGSILAGVDNSSSALIGSGSIFSGVSIKKLVVKGSVVGSVGPSGDITPVVISAPGGFPSMGGNPVALGSVTVGGRVERALILAGYQNPGNLPTPTQVGPPINPDAQIGHVTVGGGLCARLVGHVGDRQQARVQNASRG
ncbi:MAG TPA: hypothetical protein VGO11_11945, partial [Chthoniobacteraceae bacterium]|nr:hypothetical protein [Chthoniobacteraceae bacterium]